MQGGLAQQTQLMETIIATFAIDAISRGTMRMLVQLEISEIEFHWIGLDSFFSTEYIEKYDTVYSYTYFNTSNNVSNKIIDARNRLIRS